MAGAFHFESRLFRLIEKGVSLIKLNIIWILCSIPLVTGGAALCALHVTAVRILRDEEGYVFRDFWRVFTSKLGFSLKLWIPLLAAAAGLIFDYMFWQGVDGGFADGMRVLVCVLAGVWLALVFYSSRLRQEWICRQGQLTAMGSCLCSSIFSRRCIYCSLPASSLWQGFCGRRCLEQVCSPEVLLRQWYMGRC